MKFLDLFAGIGGFRLGMEAAGHECVGFCEVDKFARASYKAIHKTEGEIELHDATGITKKEIKAIGQVDVICAGFPCQPFSVAGTRRGFEDTNGTLFFEIARFASVLKPKYLFLENVKGLISHDKGYTLGNIKKTESFGGNPQCGRVYSPAGLAPCLNTMQGGQREPKIFIDGKVRKLTPRECWRLQGFPDWAFDKAQEVNSNSQLYKQAGNSVTVNVIAAIAKELK